MRIAFFQRDLPSEKVGGVANQVHLLANALMEKRHSVTVFTLSEKPPDAIYAVRPVPMPLAVRGMKILRKFLLGFYYTRIDVREFDVLHFHGDNFLMASGKPRVRTYYGSALGEALSATRPGRALSQLVFWVLELVGLCRAEVRTAISPATRRFLPCIDRIVPCGVDLRKFNSSGSRSQEPSILFVGSLHGRKRGRFMVETFERVKRIVPDARLWMVCPESVTGKGITHFPRIPEPELVNLYRRVWVVCSVSSYEGFGVPLLEAMACGAPVVSSPNSGSGYLTADGEYGLLVSDQEMAGVLADLLKDGPKRKALSEKALKRAAEFSIVKAAEAYLDIYHEIIDRIAR